MKAGCRLVVPETFQRCLQRNPFGTRKISKSFSEPQNPKKLKNEFEPKT